MYLLPDMCVCAWWKSIRKGEDAGWHQKSSLHSNLILCSYFSFHICINLFREALILSQLLGVNPIITLTCFIVEFVNWYTKRTIQQPLHICYIKYFCQIKSQILQYVITSKIIQLASRHLLLDFHFYGLTNFPLNDNFPFWHYVYFFKRRKGRFNVVYLYAYMRLPLKNLEGEGHLRTTWSDGFLKKENLRHTKRERRKC